MAANNGAGRIPNVYGTPDPAISSLLLTSRLAGAAGNDITVNVAGRRCLELQHTAAITHRREQPHGCSGRRRRRRGSRSARSSPSSGRIFRAEHGSRRTLTKNPLPDELGGTQVYFNGIRAAPLVLVSPEKVNAQIPWELSDTTSINALRGGVLQPDGSVGSGPLPVAVTIVPGESGNLRAAGKRPHRWGLVSITDRAPRPVWVSVDGTATANDTATVTIEDRFLHLHGWQSGDTLDSIRDALVKPDQTRILK